MRYRVLISAFQTSPYRGGEAAVGWGVVTSLAKHHDLWVIVREQTNREEIDRFLAANSHLLNSVHFFYIPMRRTGLLAKFVPPYIQSRYWPPSYYRYYRRWQRDALHLAEQLHREVRFDLVHQVNMVGFREPGFLWKLGVPFVWGPVGGMGFFPVRFMQTVGGYGSIYFLGYNLYNWLQMNFMRRPRLAAKVASSGVGNGLITATPGNLQGASKYWGCKSTLLSEVGLPCEPVSEIRKRIKGEPLRLVWSGLHLPRKALNLALKAVSCLSKEIDWEFSILGKGQQTSVWYELAEQLEISERCHFHGMLPRDEALVIMQEAHVMLITSLQDLTSTVIVEALAFGLPIVCLDHCGFSEVVDENCGLKIAVTTPDQVVLDIARALRQLYDNEDKRQALAKGALKRADLYRWTKKVSIINRIYHEKLGDSSRSL